MAADTKKVASWHHEDPPECIGKNCFENIEKAMVSFAHL